MFISDTVVDEGTMTNKRTKHGAERGGDYP